MMSPSGAASTIAQTMASSNRFPPPRAGGSACAAAWPIAPSLFVTVSSRWLGRCPRGGGGASRPRDGSRGAKPLADPGGIGGGLAAPGHAQLGQQAGDVVLDRFLGKVHGLTDLAVGHALGNKVKDAALGRSQPSQRISLRCRV